MTIETRLQRLERRHLLNVAPIHLSALERSHRIAALVTAGQQPDAPPDARERADRIANLINAARARRALI